MTGTDWGALYRAHAAAVAALAADLTDAQVATVVPATPAWTVHEVYAHLAGGPADAVTGRMDGAPGPEWTARHVGERLHLTVADLVDELLSHQDAVAASTVDNPRPAIVWDIAVHHADLHEAFGLGMLPEPLWSPVLAAVGPLKLGEVDARGVAPYELFRAVFSRRSRDQMRAWGLGLSDDDLDAMTVFGPRIDDQPVP